jgi:hypothetical protein
VVPPSEPNRRQKCPPRSEGCQAPRFSRANPGGVSGAVAFWRKDDTTLSAGPVRAYSVVDSGDIGRIMQRGVRWSGSRLALLQLLLGDSLRGGCSEYVRGRLPLSEALRDELGPLLPAPALQHLKV